LAPLTLTLSPRPAGGEGIEADLYSKQIIARELGECRPIAFV
jgi:hypothetical protein